MPTVTVLDSTMYYAESEPSAPGIPYVLLHGNPGNSHSWRKVVPGLAGRRVLAPDLIGMGASGKPDIAYSLADHARYLDAWFDTLGLEKAVLVAHDWGGVLAFDRAARHPEGVAGIAFFETFPRPLDSSEMSPQAVERTRMLRTPGAGEAMVAGDNRLVRSAFSGAVLTPLPEAELDLFLAPYPTEADRRPLLAWARQLPIDGEPAETVARITAYGPWLASSHDVPKLLMTFTGSPTLGTTDAMAAWCAGNIAALTTVPCGAAGHHAAEDRPAEIAAAVSAWAAKEGLG
jgi:haloalkane dehalogenase